MYEIERTFWESITWWSDLTFIDSKKRVNKLMNEALSGIDFRWSCFTRVDGLDRPVLKNMKDKGCDIVMYGFESITKDILDYFNKKVSRNQIIKAINITREVGLKVGGLFILGGPGETKESLQRVIDFCKRFKEVTRVKCIPIAAGERLFTRWAFRELLEKRAAAVLQPDLSHAGGIFEARKIAALAEVYDVAIAPHCPLSAISLAAGLQLDACTPNVLCQEQVCLGEGYLKRPFTVADGCIDVPGGPGLGIEVDEDALAERLYDGRWANPRLWHDDGSVADW